MKKKVYIGIDLGTESLKSTFAYVDNLGKLIYGKLISKDGSDNFPSLAYYLPQQNEWVYGEEVYNKTTNSFRYIVKIKQLLSMLIVGDGLYDNRTFYEDCYFPNFYFPPREDEDSGIDMELLKENEMVFESRLKVKEVCENFFKAFMKTVFYNLSIIKSFEDYTNADVVFMVVYPLGVNAEYKDEVKRLIENAFRSYEVVDYNLLGIEFANAPRSVGMYATYFNTFRDGEGALIVNIGENETSLAKISVEGKAISVDSADGHSAPIKVGGKDIDKEMIKILKDKIRGHYVLGAPDDDKSLEEGSYAQQFHLMNVVRKSKRMFSLPPQIYRENFYRGDKDVGVPISIDKEVNLIARITKNEYLDSCCSSTYQKIWEYLQKELSLDLNKDLKTIVLSGGVSDSYGLFSFISNRLREDSDLKNINLATIKSNQRLIDMFGYEISTKYRKFEITDREDMSYAACLGAIIGDCNGYITSLKATLWYGSWKTVGGARAFQPIIIKGQTMQAGDEIYSKQMHVGATTDSIPSQEYYSISADFHVDSTKKPVPDVIIGKPNTKQRTEAEQKLGLKVICGENGEGKIVFSREVPDTFLYEEGFKIVEDGTKAIPIVRTCIPQEAANKRYENVTIEIKGIPEIKIRTSGAEK